MEQTYAYKSWLAAGVGTILITMAGATPTLTMGTMQNLVQEFKKNPPPALTALQSPSQIPSGDLSSRLVGFGSSTVTTVATNGVDIMVGGDTGGLNLIHPGGKAEDLSGIVHNAAPAGSHGLRINAIEFLPERGSYLVGGAFLNEKGYPFFPLLMNLVPDGLRTATLADHVRSLGIQEIRDISCTEDGCVLTAPNGKVLFYDGGALMDRSKEFGFTSTQAPRVTSNGVVWVLVGSMQVPATTTFRGAVYLYDGKVIKVLPTPEDARVYAESPTLAVGNKGAGWLVTITNGATRTWIWNGTHFAENPLMAYVNANNMAVGTYQGNWILSSKTGRTGLMGYTHPRFEEIKNASIGALKTGPTGGLLVGGKNEKGPLLVHLLP